MKAENSFKEKIHKDTLLTNCEKETAISLVDDVNEINEHLQKINPLQSISIDYQDTSNEGECDEYGTFLIRYHMEGTEKPLYESVIERMMSIKELDASICALSQFFEESSLSEKKLNDSIDEMNNKIKEIIENKEKEEKILYYDGFSLCSLDIDNFTLQGIDMQLYDLNRLPECIKTSMMGDIHKSSMHWVNDLALVKLVKYYHNRCTELECQLKKAEEKIINDNIMHNSQ